MSSKVTLKSPSSCCETTITTHGATVVSWKVKSVERLFVSRLAGDGVPGKGIRGGIPIVFPNFGPWECGPQHGFARGKQWKVESETSSSAVFVLSNDEETEKIWKHKFQLKYIVEIRDMELSTQLHITNNNAEESFDFTTLLHTYIRVPDVHTVKLSGFEKLPYLDTITKKQEEGGVLGDIDGLHENVDRVYANTPDTHIIKCHDGTHIVIVKENLPDTVLWNPWSVKAQEMKDFGDEEYTNMVCVEAGRIHQRKLLPPGETFKAGQVITVVANQ